MRIKEFFLFRDPKIDIYNFIVYDCQKNQGVFMKKKILNLLLITIMSGIAFSSSAQISQAADFNELSPQSKKTIDAQIESFLLSHPEMLVKMSNLLQEQEILKLKTNVLNAKPALFDPSNSAIVKREGSKIAVIEFFDYNCVYCSKVYPDVKKLMESNKDVDFVLKEFPIFASSQPPSLNAAATGLKILNKKGVTAYLTYHNAVYDTKHIEGALTDKDIEKAAALVSESPATDKEKEQIIPLINKNMALKNVAAIQGTPYFIIMPLNDMDPSKVQLVGGAASYEQMQSMIDHVKSVSN